MSIVQRIKRVEKLLLRAFLAGEELYVVDHQYIDVTVATAKLVSPIEANRAYQVVDEILTAHVGNSQTRLAVYDVIADRLHQVCLAESDAAVDEKWVVALAGVLGDRRGCGMSELIAVTHNETAESIARIQSGLFNGLLLGIFTIRTALVAVKYFDGGTFVADIAERCNDVVVISFADDAREQFIGDFDRQAVACMSNVRSGLKPSAVLLRREIIF